MKKSTVLLEIQPHELRRGIEALVREEKTDFTEFQTQNRVNWLYSLTMSTARAEAIKQLHIYRQTKLSPIELLREKHDSSRLARNLNAAGKVKPGIEFEAHAIVSGKHENAKIARALLARYNIRVDDPDNGVFLPNFKRNTPNPKYPEAAAHRTIHTAQYFINVTKLLDNTGTEEEARAVLRNIGEKLIQGKFPYKRGQTV